MNLNLTDSVVVVVGGANGIGRAIASAFADEGAKVAVVDRVVPSPPHPPTPAELTTSPARGEVENKPRLLTSPLAGEVGAGSEATAPGGGYFALADATDPVAVRAAFEAITKQLGPVDHVVFAVGCGSGHYGFPFWNVPLETWDRVLRVNLTAAAIVAHTVAPIFTERRRGTLLFLSSIAGQVGSQTDPPYSAAKAGLLNFMEVCAKDFAPFGVRVNALCPGMIRTDLNKSVWQAWADRQQPGEVRGYEEWAEEKIRRTVPLGRWQTPEDVAAAAVFLASERAGNVTGQTINVDGGQVMHW